MKASGPPSPHPHTPPIIDKNRFANPSPSIHIINLPKQPQLTVNSFCLFLWNKLSFPKVKIPKYITCQKKDYLYKIGIHPNYIHYLPFQTKPAFFNFNLNKNNINQRHTVSIFNIYPKFKI